MTSPPPLLYDTYYHIYNRGNNREDIFIQERNYEYFLDLYAKYIGPIAETFAYCLLKNHFHLLVWIKSELEMIETITNLNANNKRFKQLGYSYKNRFQSMKTLDPKFPSQQFSNFFNAYAKSINKSYNRTGSLFQHPFGRVAIETDHQFWNVIVYIHHNPQKHNFVDDFRSWKWSSYGVLYSDNPTILNRAVVMDWFGGREEYLNLHKELFYEKETGWLINGDDD